jgi:hypothetical protein
MPADARVSRRERVLSFTVLPENLEKHFAYMMLLPNIVIHELMQFLFAQALSWSTER